MKRRSDIPVFGEVGTKMIEYLPGDGVFGPYVTKKIYRFRQGKNPRLVDLRDLSQLTKDAGRENLHDVNAVSEERRPKRVKEAKPEPPKAPAEIKEANDAIE